MDAEKFAHYIKNPAHLYQITYTELKSLVLQFPYCQNLRYLLLKKSILENHKEQEQNLQLAATYSLDRKLLYDQIKMGESFISESDNFIIKEDYLELKELNDVPDEPSSTDKPLHQEDPIETDALLFESETDNPTSLEQTGESKIPELIEEDLNETFFYDDLLKEEDDELEDITSEMEGVFLDLTMEQDTERPEIHAEPGESNPEEAKTKTLEGSNVSGEEDDSISIEDLIKLDNLTPLERLEKSVAEKRSKKKKNKAEKIGKEKLKEEQEGSRIEDLDHLEVKDQPESTLEIKNEEDLTIKAPKSKKAKSKSKSTFSKWLKQFQPPEEKKKKSKKRQKKKKEKKKPKSVKHTKQEHKRDTKSKNEGNKAKATAVSPKSVAEKSLKENEEIASEPLALLLVKQGSYKKAIKMYEKLSLIFPEKSSFFAEQIENLKKL